MKLSIMSSAICRTPAFSSDVSMEDVWEELKMKIRESSPTFYQSIRGYSFWELENLDGRVRFTIWKYFQRAKFRATPFGSFASVSLVDISAEPDQSIEISSQMKIRSYRDWSEADFLARKMDAEIAGRTIVFRNSSVYNVMEEVRYIRTRGGKFEIAATEALPELLAVLEACNHRQSVSKITAVLKEKFGVAVKDALAMLTQLLSMQLLFTEDSPNIIGRDYFARMNSEASSAEQKYLISERNVHGGSLPYGAVEKIKDLVLFLHRNLPGTSHEPLDTFKNAFREKFEGREMPLSQVMDPEVGIGYGGFEQPVVNNGLNFIRNIGSEDIVTIAYSQFHTFILNGIISGEPIDLAMYDGENVLAGEKLPNTFSVLVHFFEGNPVIAHIGGATATSLVGRFTLLDPKFEQFAFATAAIEQEANPDVLFFDIAYQAEQRVDNVNRRQRIYPQELPILTLSCLDNPLDFNDILVSVQNGIVVLKSKRYGKRLIPRIPSAYNYTRSDLSVYRFLCDVQNQELRINLSFAAKATFPNLLRYPRVLYGNIVVSPAMWMVPKALTEKFSSADNGSTKDLLSWFEKEKIDFVFKAGETDSVLYFDPEKPADLQAFVMYCRQRTEDVYISEALVSAETQVGNELGEQYFGQFALNLYHRDNIYPGLAVSLPALSNIAGSQRTFLPGSDWLYYELYCYPTRSNDILRFQLKNFLAEAKPYLKRWFFVRYDFPAPHIRLRLNLKEACIAFLINGKFLNFVEPSVHGGQLSSVSIKTYFRELERYGESRIGQIEDLFCHDSKYVMALLAKALSTEQLYVRALFFIHNVFLADMGQIEERIRFARTMADSFADEMRMTPVQFRELNQAFNHIRDEVESAASNPIGHSVSKYRKALSRMLVGTTQTERSGLLRDLIHMHVNRIFISDQRMHETVLYHYLLRYLLAARARKSNRSLKGSSL